MHDFINAVFGHEKVPPQLNKKEETAKIITVDEQMKKIVYKSKERTENAVLIPKGNFASDWFRCDDCGYEVQIKTLSSTIECSECGGKMHRI